MNRFDNMETFIRVVEAGSISGAANRMGVAKSAVSRRLKELETHLGVELFHRTTRRMNLTDTGHTFYRYSTRILEDVLEAELATSQAHGKLQGRLRIALPSSFGLLHMNTAISAFSQLHPEIEFDLDFNDREVDLMQEGFDMAIRIIKLTDSSLIARRLATMRTVVCASPAYLERMGIPNTPEELTKYHCLTYTLRQDAETWYFHDTQGKRLSVKIRPHLKASSGEFLRDVAVDGLGIVLLPSFIVYKEIERRALVPLLTDYPTPAIDAYAIYPHTRHLSQRVRTFVNFLIKRFEGTPYWDTCLQMPTTRK